MNPVKYLSGKIIPITISCTLGSLCGVLFFIMKGSPESVVIRVRPALLYTLQAGDSGFKQLESRTVESNIQFQSRLQKYFIEKCSPASIGFKILVKSDVEIWEYVLQRIPGQDSFTGAIRCALNNVISDHAEIVKFLSASRVKPLPSAFTGTEKTEIIGLVDFTLRTNTLNRIRAVVVGFVAACIAYLAISFLLRILSSARHGERGSST